MSRFGRDFYETVRTVRRLRDRGVQFHSASERIDLESPNGRLMFNVLASFDEYELDIRREYWAETKARVMQERGVHLGRTPLGYLRASKQPKRSCDVTLERAGELLAALGSSREPVSGGLVPDPALAPWIRRAFAMRASGARLVEVVDTLNREAPRPGGRLWTHTHVQRMLRLRVYLGEVGQADLVVPDAHEPLVAAPTFAAVQGLSPDRSPRCATAEFHLRGLIRCAGCGFPMVGWNQPRTRASGAVERVRVYRCVRQRAGGRCEQRAVVSADAVEQLVRAAVEPYARGFVAAAPAEASDERLVAVQVELQQVEERIRSLHRDLRGELDADLWQELVVDLGRRRRELAAQRDALGAQSASASTA